MASKPPGPLDPGKATSLQIKYDAKGDLLSTGRMMVTAKGLPPWIFYLQGEWVNKLNKYSEDSWIIYLNK